MRSHLAKYFRQGKMFPFQRKRYRPKFLHPRKPKNISLHCSCLMPETWVDMVTCDSCDQWSTCMCVGLKVMPASEEQWICNDCERVQDIVVCKLQLCFHNIIAIVTLHMYSSTCLLRVMYSYEVKYSNAYIVMMMKMKCILSIWPEKP